MALGVVLVVVGIGGRWEGGNHHGGRQQQHININMHEHININIRIN